MNVQLVSPSGIVLVEGEVPGIADVVAYQDQLFVRTDSVFGPVRFRPAVVAALVPTLPNPLDTVNPG